MAEIETDYLVVGAGAAGMAFTDTLIAETDADVVMVDRRHRPGGHWVDAYPFVRLHQPSAFYGVGSRVLGHDRVDETGPNAGFYERATAAEMCDYYDRVLEEHLLPSGSVRFFGMSDYRFDPGSNGSGEHRFVSRLTGETTTVKVRRKLVDTTYQEGSIPSKHTPSFEVDADVRLIPPNELVNLGDGASGYTVIGAGKTSMDTCNWLLDQGVDPERIRWIRPRDGWAFVRPPATQSLTLGALDMYSRWTEAMAEASCPAEIMLRLESHGVATRIDPDIEPAVFRGSILSEAEVRSLRRIEGVVRKGKVRRISTDRLILDEDSLSSDATHVYVDCSASALNPRLPRPIYEADRITLQVVTIGIIPWSAATQGYVEATRVDDREKNRLCPPMYFTGELADPPHAFYEGLKAVAARMAEPDVAAWNEDCRLNPLRGAMSQLDDPRIQAGFARMATNIEPAIANLERMIAEREPLEAVR